MLCLLSVVWTNLRRQIGRKQLSRIKVRTLWRPMGWPRSAIAVVSLRLPYALWLAAKAALMWTLAAHTLGAARCYLCAATFA